MTWKALRTIGVTVAVGLGALIVVPPVSAASPTAAQVAQASATSAGTFKAAHDTDPHLPISGPHHVAPTSSVSRAAVPNVVCCGGNPPQSLELGQDQQQQATWYYCGAATVSEILGDLNKSLSQSSAASILQTNTNGTAWSGVYASVPSGYQTGYPVPDVLNYEISDVWYGPVGLPYTPTSGDTSTYENNMVGDIWDGYPVAGDAWMAPGGYVLNGWPTPTGSTQYFHWFAVIGYGSSGATTDYEDSATNQFPGHEPPPYTTGFSSPDLVSILGGRGYVW